MTVNVSDPNNWNLIWNETYEQQPVPDTVNKFYPIATVNIPVLFSSEYLLINTTSVNAPIHWKTAGYLRQAFDSPVIGAASAANFSSKKVYLHRLTLIQLPLLNTTYSVLIDIPNYLLDISISIFQYEPN